MKNTKQQAIGLFDSGVGGTSIWKELHEYLPMESTLYLADSKNAPYGVKSQEEIVRLSEKNTEILLEKACKLIVVACNTATTNAIAHLRAKYPVPFIGIEPAIKPASLNSKTKSIGILATKGTLSSSLFLETSSLYSKGIKVTEQEGTGLVELIESGRIHSNETHELLAKYLKPMIDQNIDYLVLGCSHYPYLIPIIQKILPEKIQIIDSGLAVARQTAAVLKSHDLLSQSSEKGSCHFFSNTDIEVLRQFVGKEHNITYLDF